MKFGHALALNILIAVLVVPEVLAQQDMKGSRDHPEIPRIEGTEIRGFAYNEYDEAEFVTGFADRKLERTRVGGKRTRMVYLGPEALSLVEVFKNYGVALAELGERKTIYSCDVKCASNLGSAFVWAPNARVPVSHHDMNLMYASGLGIAYRDQGYAYLTVTNEQNRYHISIYSAFLTGFQARSLANRRAIHVDILEEAGFSPTLQVVTPDEITQGIAEKGRIALYGILFEFDSDVLTADALPALEAIATALNNDPNLTIYVVGHTDNQGSYEYNVSLSQRRAAAVIRKLTSDFGIASERLTSVGVGPVAPVASNKSEAGQALNRRVELVEQ